MTGIPRRSLIVGGGAAASLAAIAGATPAGAAPAPTLTARDRPGRDSGSIVVAWNQALLRIVRTPGAQPGTVHATRSFAILHAALYDAVVACTGGAAYLFTVVAERDASPVAAAAQAAHDVLVALYPAQVAELDARLATDLATVSDAGDRAAGIRVGRLTARLLLGLRTGDGSAATPPVLAPGTEPGQWRPAPPALAAAVFTHWPAVTPFVLDRADRFRSEPYPDLAGTPYARATNEVLSLGRDTSATRTADQTVAAKFWAASIWNYWNEIAQGMVTSQHVDLTGAARLFARLNLTFADAVIAFYDAKYHDRIWRPVTAIRLADTDGNPATAGDPAWSPLANTPADPAYPGAHSVIGQAGALILRDVFGAHRGFTVTSEVLAGVTRTFGGFQDAADEAGLSRIFAGVHTRIDHDAGQRLGAGVARFALYHAF